jgi:hypothetical protein
MARPEGRMTLVTYLLFLGGALAICLVAWWIARPLNRRCPQCHAMIRVDSRRCRHCRYQFT